MKKAALTLITAAALTFLFAAGCVCADFEDYRELIPTDIAAMLPEGILSNDADAAVRELTDKLSFSSLLHAAADALKDSLIPGGLLFSKLLAVVIITSLFGAMKSSVEKSAAVAVFDFAVMLCVSLFCFESMRTILDTTASFLQNLCTFMTALAPFSSAILCSSGNVTSAAVTSGGLLLLVDFLQYLCTYALMPVLCVCVVLNLCDTGVFMSTRGLSSLLRRIYTFTLSFCAALLVFTLSSQNSLAQSADSMVSRTLRFIIGGSVPIVGGALSEALRTVNASLNLIRSVTGHAGIVMVIITLLPVFFYLTVNSLAFAAASAVADIFGSERECSLMSEMSGICSLAVAVCAMSALLFIFALTLFVKIIPAQGG